MSNGRKDIFPQHPGGKQIPIIGQPKPIAGLAVSALAWKSEDGTIDVEAVPGGFKPPRSEWVDASQLLDMIMDGVRAIVQEETDKALRAYFMSVEREHVDRSKVECLE